MIKTSYVTSPKTRLLVSALFVSAVVMFAPKAHAQSYDKWGDTHNWIHLGVLTASGGVAHYFIANPYEAFAVGFIPAVLREEYKRERGFDHWSRSRTTFDLAGDALGVWGSHMIFYKDGKQTVIAYQASFDLH